MRPKFTTTEAEWFVITGAMLVTGALAGLVGTGASMLALIGGVVIIVLGVVSRKALNRFQNND